MAAFIASNNVAITDVEPVFNLGCGMIAIVASDDAAAFMVSATEMGLAPRDIGQVACGQGPAVVRYL